MDTTGAKRVTLDVFLERNRIERIDFVKMDVDGNECRVLRGALDTLREHKIDLAQPK